MLDLVEPLFKGLRMCDSDKPTVGIVYQLFLEAQEELAMWETTKFDNVTDGPAGVAFERSKCSLLSNKNHEDTGLGEAADWTAKDILVFRWTKMHRTKSTGLIHAAGRLLNPAFRAYDHKADNLINEMNAYFKLFFGDTADGRAKAQKAYAEWKVYQAQDFEGELFYYGSEEKPECSWAGEFRGLGGAGWWFDLPREFEQLVPTLREVAMKVLGQTSTESAAERHFSAVEVIQPKNRASLTPATLKQRTFVRAEIQAELAKRSVRALLYVEDLEAYDGLDADILYPKQFEDAPDSAE